MPEKKENKPVQGKGASVKKKERKPRIDLVKKFREMVAELKKVTWPTRKELIRHSTVVIIFIVLITTVIALYDLALTSLMRLVI